MTKVLIVDDDPVQLRLTSEVAARAGFEAMTAKGGLEALTVLRGNHDIGVMVLDLVMPDLDGMAVLDQMNKEGLRPPVIVQTAASSRDAVTSAIRLGAVDFFVKPVDPERLTVSLRNVLKVDRLESLVQSTRAMREGNLGFDSIVSESPVMERVTAQAKKAAKSSIPVLIEGETGVGKEMLARAIQGTGDRAGRPFVVVNCATLSSSTSDSTLFGYVRGAFSGAGTDQKGAFEKAAGGTLFLDEVGELPMGTQEKLLQAVQDEVIVPLGAREPVKINVRLITATNRRLLNMARAGTFREDLYYRLNVFPIYVPPLRERPEDIESLVEQFIADLGAQSGKRIQTISPDTLALLLRYDWPGNIRQLENAVFRAMVLCESRELESKDFPQIRAEIAGVEEVRREITSLRIPSMPVHIDDAPLFLGRSDDSSADFERFLGTDGEVLSMADVERELIVYAIKHYQGHMSKVARALKIGRSTLYRKLREYGLDGAADDTAASA